MFILSTIVALLALCAPAQAQQRTTLDKVQAKGLSVGDHAALRLERFDNVLSLDEDILGVEAVGEGRIELTAMSPGTATVLVLRGGLTESILISVQAHLADGEAYARFHVVPDDGVPSWSATSLVATSGTAQTGNKVVATYGGGIRYRSKDADVTHRSDILVGSSIAGTRIARILSWTSTNKADALLGQVVVAPGQGSGSFSLLGGKGTYRPGGREGAVGLDLTVGHSQSPTCCGLFNPDGEVVALAGAGLRVGASQSHVAVGTFIPRRDPTPGLLAIVDQRIELDGLRGMVRGARIGDGFAGSMSLSQASKRYRATLVGSLVGKGAYQPSLGPSDSTKGWGSVTGERFLGRRTVIGVDAGVRAEVEGEDDRTQSNGGLSVTAGGRTRVRGRYGITHSRSADAESVLGHQVAANFDSRSVRRFTMRGMGLVNLDQGLGYQGASVQLSALSEVGPILEVGPSFWGLLGKESSVFGIGGTLKVERARVRQETLLHVQTTVNGGRLTIRPNLDGRVEWKALPWAAVFSAASVGVSLGDSDLRYRVSGGFRVGGSVQDLLATGSVTGRVFVDTDGDGVFSGADYGVKGVSIEVLDKSHVSQDGGLYRFRGLLPGQYSVHVNSPGYILRDGEAPSVRVGRFGKVVVDIPLVERKRLDIRVFADLDGDGRLDVGEWGVDADLVSIDGPGGLKNLSAANGELVLVDVEMGSYAIKVSAPMLEEGYVPSGPLERSVTVDGRGFRRVLFPVVPQRQIGGRVCRDVNDNGRLDGVDACVEGVVVRLSTGAVTKTRTDGRYFFTDVEPGDHTVESGAVSSRAMRFDRLPRSVKNADLLLPFRSAPAPKPSSGARGSLALKAMRLQIDETALKVGEREAVAITGTYSDFSQHTMQGVSISSTRPEVARVVDGVIFAIAEGTTRLRAVSGKVNSPEVEVRVRRLPVVGLIARPGRIDLPFGEVETISAKAIFVDGDAETVTDRVDWRCDDAQVCRVEGNGVFVAVGPGSTLLRGVYLNVSSQPIEVRVSTGDAVPTRMQIAPGALTLGLESTGRVYVDASLSNGRDVHLTTEVAWKTDSPEVIRILPGGRIRPITVGKARITATFKGIESESAIVEVVPAVGLMIVPTLGVVPAGISVPVRAFEVLGDGSIKEIKRIKWTTDNPDVAVVEEGRVRTAEPGIASITASYKSMESLPVSVEVIPANIAELRASESRMVLAGDQEGYVDAIATFEGGRESVATSVVRWTSSDPTVVTVEEDGVIKPVGQGRSVVTGSWLGRSTGPIEVLVDPTVSEVPAAILVEPSAISISAQGTQALAVSLVSESGRLLPDEGVRFEVADPSVAWVERGELRAVSVGSTEIVAVHGDVRSLPVSVTVKPVVGVIADPPLGRLPVGARVQLQALALVDDGSLEDLTDSGSVQWSSDHPEVVQISNDGTLLAFKAGKARITATWRNMKTNPMALEVADADIATLAIDPSQASIRVAEVLPLAVVAMFEDGVIADATPHVTWTSTRPSVARVDQSRLLGSEPGVAEVFSTWMGIQSASVRVTVAPASAVGVILGNASEVMLVGQRIPLQATALTEDGQLLDSTSQTTWRVEDPSVVAVDTNGFVEALAPGQTSLVGIVGGQESPPLPVEVVGLAVVRLDLAPGALAVVPDAPVGFTVVATLADGRAIDVTPQVSWEIDGRGVAVDRFNQLQVGHNAKARIRARIDEVRSGWAEIVATD